MPRRPDGALEHDIMRVLWSASTALSPAEVNARLAQGLAYTTIATVLGRLHAKGLAARTNPGRGFAYTAAIAEPELTGQRMAEVLVSAADRSAALAGLVRNLSKRDAKTLRALLEDGTS
jgi:predicted transcriptional regulator